MPGCPNPEAKRTFARADGLRRHQESVSHWVPYKNNDDTRSRAGRSSTGSQEPRAGGARAYLKPEHDFSVPDSGDSEMDDASSLKLET